ncbi:hypothetical protein OHB06_01220 [Streptomyces sp. NBC_01604]|uniref:hypothetical protein n=1 Tax=Streptomyces sp. NBC_01604 TaxID=2975894 RepID=UPI003864BADD
MGAAATVTGSLTGSGSTTGSTTAGSAGSAAGCSGSSPRTEAAIFSLGGGLLGGLDALDPLGADVLNRSGQLAELGQVVGGDGGAARLRVEGPHGTFEEGVQLFVVEGGDVLGKRELFQGAGLQKIDLGVTRPKTSGRLWR